MRVRRKFWGGALPRPATNPPAQYVKGLYGKGGQEAMRPRSKLSVVWSTQPTSSSRTPVQKRTSLSTCPSEDLAVVTVLVPDCNLEPDSETIVGQQGSEITEVWRLGKTIPLSSGGRAVATDCQAQLRDSLRGGKQEATVTCFKN